MVRHPQIGSHLGFKNFRQTSAEILRGFENETVGGVLSVHSVEFSSRPEMVVDRIDDVLIPGGAFKMVMFHRDEAGLMQCFRFVFSFIQRGYNLALMKGSDKIMWDTDVLLAIKPGGKLDTKAVSLMHKDARKYYEWEDDYRPP